MINKHVIHTSMIYPNETSHRQFKDSSELVGIRATDFTKGISLYLGIRMWFSLKNAYFGLLNARAEFS
jgi:hypothetical protein